MSLQMEFDISKIKCSLEMLLEILMAISCYLQVSTLANGKEENFPWNGPICKIKTSEELLLQKWVFSNYGHKILFFHPSMGEWYKTCEAI